MNRPGVPSRPSSSPSGTATLAAVAAVAAVALGCSAARPPPAPPAAGPPPLAGQIWQVVPGRAIDLAALEAALPAADVVLLGETHDNPEHHRIEARLLSALAAAGRRPAVAFEMLDPEQQAALDAARARAPRDPDALAAAVDWARSGWPDWSLYRPVFAAALDAGLPIVAANLPRRRAHEVARGGPAALAAPARALLERAPPLTGAAARELRAEMAEQHCGLLPERALDGMVLMQRARDAELAARTLAASAGGGAVLVTGAGHARTDRGVPAYLAVAAPPPRVVSVGLLEVLPDAPTPAAHAAALGLARLPYDYVVFTERAEREDPCEELRRRHPSLTPAAPPGEITMASRPAAGYPWGP